MVDGIGGNQSQNQNILKLKGQKKTIDLNGLVGLRQTDKNKAIFERFDHDKNGVIDQNEAKQMQLWMNKAAGNDKISNREMNKTFGKDTFSALSALADQQAVGKGKEYVEINGNKSTTIYRSNVDSEHDYFYTKTNHDDGSSTIVSSDGKQTIQHKDGSRDVIDKDGTIISYDAKGKKTAVIKDGLTTTFTPDGNKSITKNADGQTVSSMELRDNKEILTKYEYSNGNTIAREYADGAQIPSSIIVSGRSSENGPTTTIETKYNSEDDMKNNRPSSKTENKGLATETTTTFEYDSKGNKKVSIYSGGSKNPVTHYENSEGKTISAGQYDATQTYTVQKGDSITQIVTNALKEQGFANPTSEQIHDAKEQFMEMNKDNVRTFGGKASGKKGFFPNDTVSIPNFKSSISDVYLNNVDVTAAKITPEMKAKRQAIQQQLGDNVDVTYAKDGSLEVRNKNGVLLEDVTAMVNKPSDIDIMMKSDKNNSKTLDTTEYKSMILAQLKAIGIEINDKNKAQIEQLIDKSFNDIDTIKQDRELTKEELQKNAPQIISNLADEINKIAEPPLTQNTSGFVDSPVGNGKNTDTENYFA